MTVYVDQYHKLLRVPKKWEGGGHLIGTDIDELHKFAQSIGLKREWYQGHTGFPHYDLVQSKRNLAIIHGAVPIEAGYIPGDVIRRDLAHDRI